MKIGDTVIIVGVLDERVRAKNEERMGTVIDLHGDEVEVLLPSGDIFRGHRRDVAKQ